MNIGDKVRHRDTGRTGTLRAKNYNRWASQFVEWDDGMTAWYHEAAIEAAPEPSSTFKEGDCVALVQEFAGQAPEPLPAGAVGVVREVRLNTVYVIDFPQRERTTRVAERYLRRATAAEYRAGFSPDPAERRTELGGFGVGDRVQGKGGLRMHGVVTGVDFARALLLVRFDELGRVEPCVAAALDHETEPRKVLNGIGVALEDMYARVGLPTQYETKTVDAIKRLPKPELVNDLHETHVDLNGRRYCVTVERVS